MLAGRIRDQFLQRSARKKVVVKYDATFSERPLGFTLREQDGHFVVSSSAREDVKEWSRVIRVGDRDVVDLTYEEVLELLTSRDLPLTVGFEYKETRFSAGIEVTYSHPLFQTSHSGLLQSFQYDTGRWNIDGMGGWAVVSPSRIDELEQGGADAVVAAIAEALSGGCSPAGIDRCLQDLQVPSFQPSPINYETPALNTRSRSTSLYQGTPFSDAGESPSVAYNHTPFQGRSPVLVMSKRDVETVAGDGRTPVRPLPPLRRQDCLRGVDLQLDDWSDAGARSCDGLLSPASVILVSAQSSPPAPDAMHESIPARPRSRASLLGSASSSAPMSPIREASRGDEGSDYPSQAEKEAVRNEANMQLWSMVEELEAQVDDAIDNIETNWKSDSALDRTPASTRGLPPLPQMSSSSTPGIPLDSLPALPDRPCPADLPDSGDYIVIPAKPLRKLPVDLLPAPSAPDASPSGRSPTVADDASDIPEVPSDAASLGSAESQFHQQTPPPPPGRSDAELQLFIGREVDAVVEEKVHAALDAHRKQIAAWLEEETQALNARMRGMFAEHEERIQQHSRDLITSAAEKQGEETRSSYRALVDEVQRHMGAVASAQREMIDTVAKVTDRLNELEAGQHAAADARALQAEAGAAAGQAGGAAANERMDDLQTLIQAGRDRANQNLSATIDTFQQHHATQEQIATHIGTVETDTKKHIEDITTRIRNLETANRMEEVATRLAALETRNDASERARREIQEVVRRCDQRRQSSSSDTRMRHRVREMQTSQEVLTQAHHEVIGSIADLQKQLIEARRQMHSQAVGPYSDVSGRRLERKMAALQREIEQLKERTVAWSEQRSSEQREAGAARRADQRVQSIERTIAALRDRVGREITNLDSSVTRLEAVASAPVPRETEVRVRRLRERARDQQRELDRITARVNIVEEAQTEMSQVRSRSRRQRELARIADQLEGEVLQPGAAPSRSSRSSRSRRRSSDRYSDAPR